MPQIIEVDSLTGFHNHIRYLIPCLVSAKSVNKQSFTFPPVDNEMTFIAIQRDFQNFWCFHTHIFVARVMFRKKKTVSNRNVASVTAIEGSGWSGEEQLQQLKETENMIDR